MVTGTRRKGSRDGIYGAILETSLVGVGGTVPVASRTKRGPIVVPEGAKLISGTHNAP